jgi:hypothetical protein
MLSGSGFELSSVSHFVVSPILWNWTLANSAKHVISGEFLLKGSYALVPFD